MPDAVVQFPACPVPPASRAARRAAGRRRGAVRARSPAHPSFNIAAWRAAHAERCPACARSPRSSSCYFQHLARALHRGWALPLAAVPPRAEYKNYQSAYDNAPAVTAFLALLVRRGRARVAAATPHLVAPMGVVFRSQDTAHDKPRTTVDETAAGLNAALPPWLFSYDSVARALERFPRASWLAKVDLAKYYTQLSILEQHRTLLGVEWLGVYYEFTSPPFGISLAPAFASWVSAEIAAIARARGISVVATYIDDFLLAAPTAAAASAQLSKFLALLTELGVEYGPEKVEGPAQRMVFLGVGIDTVSAHLWLAPRSVEAFCAALRDAASRPALSPTAVQQLTGKLAWFGSVCTSLRWYARPFYSALAAAAPSAPVRVPPAAFTALLSALSSPDLLISPITAWLPPRPAVLLRTDASGSIGYGGHVGRRAFARPWHRNWQGCRSMTARELWPVAEALRLFPSLFRDKPVVVAMDNSSAVYAICRGHSACPASHRVLGRLLAAAAACNATLSPVHLPREQNTVADALSRFCSPWTGYLDAAGCPPPGRPAPEVAGG